VTKTVTPLPRTGNAMPRLVETACGALNSIGLENVGFEDFLANVLPELEARGVPTVVSLAATTPEDFGPLVRRLHEHASGFAHWHGVELNLSCPNVAEGGHDFGSAPATVARCVAAARAWLPDRALLAKITPNVADIAQLALAARDAGADAVSAINTVVGLDVDLRTGQPYLPRRFGGYSGQAILPIALGEGGPDRQGRGGAGGGRRRHRRAGGRPQVLCAGSRCRAGRHRADAGSLRRRAHRARPGSTLVVGAALSRRSRRDRRRRPSPRLRSAPPGPRIRAAPRGLPGSRRRARRLPP
jgi:hypothetical protein